MKKELLVLDEVPTKGGLKIEYLLGPHASYKALEDSREINGEFLPLPEGTRLVIKTNLGDMEFDYVNRDRGRWGGYWVPVLNLYNSSSRGNPNHYFILTEGFWHPANELSKSWLNRCSFSVSEITGLPKPVEVRRS